jgi:hypothetical protein
MLRPAVTVALALSCLAGCASAPRRPPETDVAFYTPPPPVCTEERTAATVIRVYCDYYAQEQTNAAWTEALRRAAVSSLAAGFPLVQTLNVSSMPLTRTVSTPVECKARPGFGYYKATCTGGDSTVPAGARMSADFEFLTEEQGAARNTPLIPEDRRPWSSEALLRPKPAASAAPRASGPY